MIAELQGFTQRDHHIPLPKFIAFSENERHFIYGLPMMANGRSNWILLFQAMELLCQQLMPRGIKF